MRHHTIFADGYADPTFIPNQAAAVAPVSPAGWLWDNVRAWWTATIGDNSRGTPEPLGVRDQRQLQPAYFQPPRWGDYSLILTRRFDRGAQAFGYRFGAMSFDPIGPGVVTTRPFEATKPAANYYRMGIGITWEPQPINFALTMNPRGPLVPPQMLAAIQNNPAIGGVNPQEIYDRSSADSLFGGEAWSA